MGGVAMSVINQMLQDLEHRRSRPAGDASLSAQVRAVPQRRQLHPAWWIAGGVLLASAVAVAWVQLRPDAVDAAPAVMTPETLATVDTSATLAPAPRAATEIGAAIPASDSMSAANAVASSSPAMPPAATPAASAGAIAAAPSADRTAAPDSLAATSAESAPQSAAISPVNSERTRLAELRAEQARHEEAELESGAIPVTKEITAQQRNQNEYGKAVAMVQAGQTAEAIQLLGNVLQADPGNAQARHTLIGLLVEGRNFSEAERRLQEGLKLDPAQTGLAVILARLQVERGAAPAALQTLQRSLPHAAGHADYLAFLAALLQREGRHKEAIDYYLQALRSEPNSGVWLMGLGLSLKADNRAAEARDALGRALASNTLSPDLRAYVEQQLRQLRP
jgi:MSHA biogenesis protein MshN